MAPAESTTYTHWQPASAMIRAWPASTSGGWEWAIIRNPTVSSPISRARPKCWMEMSASVQCVATRTIDTPRSAHALMSSFVPSPGSISAAILARRAVSTAAFISTRSSVFEKP